MTSRTMLVKNEILLLGTRRIVEPIVFCVPVMSVTLSSVASSVTETDCSRAVSSKGKHSDAVITMKHKSGFLRACSVLRFLFCRAKLFRVPIPPC